MGQPAAKQGDSVVALDIHIQMVPTPGGPVPVPLPSPFNGTLDGNLSTNVFIGGMAAATVGSTATNTPQHIPVAGPFQRPPMNQATVFQGSTTVFINGKPAARMGDPATTCNDPADLPAGTVVAAGTVFFG